MEQIVEIEGITYQIIQRDTPDALRARGLGNIAAHLETNGKVAQVYLRRPRGQQVYFSIERNVYGHTVYTRPLSLL